jgi:hypothetical protein
MSRSGSEVGASKRFIGEEEENIKELWEKQVLGPNSSRQLLGQAKWSKARRRDSQVKEQD